MRDFHIESVTRKKKHLSPVFRPPHLVPTQLGQVRISHITEPHALSHIPCPPNFDVSLVFLSAL